MKKVILGAVLAAMVAVPAFAEVKVEMMTWGDVDKTMTTNAADTISPNYTGGQARIDRAYFTIKGDIGKDGIGSKIKGRVTIDFSKIQFDSTSASTKSIPMKYAYVDYDFMGLGYAVLSGGLLKTQFGNIANWEYTMPVKDATEAYIKFTPSADFGFALSGKALPIEGLTKSLLNYSFQLVNGEGYEKLFKSSSYKSDLWCGIINLAVSPYKGVSIGGSYRMNNASLTNIGDYIAHENALAVYAIANDLEIGDIKLPMEFLFQYLSQDKVTTNTINSTVMTVSLAYGLLDKVITPFVRYDMIDTDTSAGGTNKIGSDKDYSYFYGGLTIAPTKNFKIKGLYGKKIGGNEDSLLKLELESKLDFSIWQ